MGYVSFEELCEMAKLSKGQLSYLIKYKQIVPINQDSWKADGGYRFRQEDAENLAESYKDLLSLKEAAAYLQKSKTYVLNAVKEGSLPSKEVAKGKTTERLYHLKDLKEFKSKMNNVDMVNKRLYDHMQLYFNNLLLFDTAELHGQEVRVIDVSKRVGVNSHNEQLIISEEVISNHFSGEAIQKKKITKPGDASFLFPLYTAYDVMLHVISHLGVSNILVSKKNEGYFMKCKLGSIPYNAHVFRVLSTCLMSGNLQHKKEMIHLTNNKEHVSLYLEAEVVETAKQIAKDKGYKGYKKVFEEIIYENLKD